MRKTFLVIIASLVLFAIIPAQTVSAGIGITPATIVNNKLRPGTTYTKDLVFSQADPSETLSLTLEPDFGDYNDWFSFEPSNQITVEPGVQRVSVTVKITVPADAELSPTEGAIRIQAQGTGSGDTIEVVQGAKIDVSLATTTASYEEFIIRSITMSDVDENGVGTVSVKVENVGNVAASPTRVILDVLSLNEVLIDTFNIAGFDTVQPGETTESILNFNGKSLESGEYFANVAVLKDTQTLRQERLVFSVAEQKQASDPVNSTNNVFSDLNQFLEDNKLLSLLLVVLIATAFTALLILLFRNSEERENEVKRVVRGKAKKETKKKAKK